MTSKIIINTERCKGCGLCVTACVKDCIEIAKESNKHGYFPAQAKSNNCSGCINCAIVCPEAIIEVHRDSRITEIKSVKKGKSRLVKDTK